VTGGVIRQPSRPAAKLSRVSELRRVNAIRYVTPLREGGSLPGLMEADDDGLYVTKFRGAGQGAGALVAEVVAGELARALGLPVPQLVVVEVDPALGRAEPDPEIQELVVGSAGANLGMDFLPGALPFALAADPPADPAWAADVVWLDALVMNVDRTHGNPNLLVWHGRTWLIDHGAAFFRQHDGQPLAPRALDPLPREPFAQHVLLPVADPIAEADARLATAAQAAVDDAIAAVPEAWLGAEPSARRRDVADFLHARLTAPRGFVEEVERVR
jgi:hypothetical protein